ncbi:MAG: hypothetical protein L7S64_12095 [Longimicrobiales bacterium]|nr:hypothetical protein [Longimicrobiales bacterium]
MTHRLISRSTLTLILICGITAGCASSGSTGLARGFSGADGEILTITVRNQQLDEARVYLWVDGQRERLGSVRSNASEVFHHPIDAIQAVQMEFDVILGPRCITRGVSLGPGDDVEATIPSQLVAFAGNCR